jgi:hypothetical protein
MASSDLEVTEFTELEVYGNGGGEMTYTFAARIFDRVRRHSFSQNSKDKELRIL